MRFTCEFLAGDIASYDVFGVPHGSWLIETCSESLGHEDAATHVVAIDSLMDLEW